MAITFSELGINRALYDSTVADHVRGQMDGEDQLLVNSVPEKLVSRFRFNYPAPRQPALQTPTRAFPDDASLGRNVIRNRLSPSRWLYQWVLPIVIYPIECAPLPIF